MAEVVVNIPNGTMQRIVAEEVERHLPQVRREAKRELIARLREKARWHAETGSPGDATLNDLADVLERELSADEPATKEETRDAQ